MQSSSTSAKASLITYECYTRTIEFPNVTRSRIIPQAACCIVPWDAYQWTIVILRSKHGPYQQLSFDHEDIISALDNNQTETE